MSEFDPQTKMVNSGIRICPSCDRDNLPDAALCVYCGAALGTTTVIVPDKPLGVTRTNYLSQIIRLHDDALILLIATQDQPVVLKGDGKFSIGRPIENEYPPTLDMTRYGGHMLGVSRRHATIQRTADGYMIEDLGSANGTFINEKRIPAHQPYTLRNGDLIRLGQLILFAYFAAFREKRSATITEQTIWLVEKREAKTHSGLTVQGLVSQILPYLNAIATLQHIIDDLTGRSTAEMEISQIGIEKNSGSIKINFMNCPDSVQLIQDKLNALRQKVATGFKPNQTEASMLDSNAPIENFSTTLHLEGELDIHQEIFASHRELAGEILVQIAPSLPEEEHPAYIQRLLVPLYTLTTSRFELTTAPQ
jgi:pSer/pThr/pTyr-binding forkhead associated (FHA) protein